MQRIFFIIHMYLNKSVFLAPFDTEYFKCLQFFMECKKKKKKKHGDRR